MGAGVRMAGPGGEPRVAASGRECADGAAGREPQVAANGRGRADGRLEASRGAANGRGCADGAAGRESRGREWACGRVGQVRAAGG